MEDPLEDTALELIAVGRRSKKDAAPPCVISNPAARQGRKDGSKGKKKISFSFMQFLILGLPSNATALDMAGRRSLECACLSLGLWLAKNN